MRGLVLGNCTGQGLAGRSFQIATVRLSPSLNFNFTSPRVLEASSVTRITRACNIDAIRESGLLTGSHLTVWIDARRYHRTWTYTSLEKLRSVPKGIAAITRARLTGSEILVFSVDLA